jgi:hypothetical protein
LTGCGGKEGLGFDVSKVKCDEGGRIRDRLSGVHRTITGFHQIQHPKGVSAMVKSTKSKTVYLRGFSDLLCFNDYLLSISYKGDSYKLPSGSYSFIEISEDDWINNPDELPRRNLFQ